MGPLSLTNPWVILALVVLLAGVGWKSYDFGVDVEAGRQIAANAKALKAAHDQRDKAIEAGRKMTAGLMALNKKTEDQYVAETAKTNGLRLANGRLVAAHGGLYDKNGRATGRSPAAPGPDPADAGGDRPAATGCALSDAVTVDLLDFARDADAVVDIARACKAYAVELRGLLENSCRPVASAPGTE